MITFRAFLTSLCLHLLLVFTLAGFFWYSEKVTPKYVEIELSLEGLRELKEETKETSEKKLVFQKREIEPKVKGIDEPIIEKPKEEFPKTKMVETLREDTKAHQKEERALEEERPKIKEASFSDFAEGGKVSSSLKESSSSGQRAISKKGEEKGILGSSELKEGEGEGHSNLSPEKARERFLLEKLHLISNLVRKHLEYPLLARRMGWEGKVIISFILTEEGKIEEVKIESSSGYKVLDESAVKALFASSKYFPHPPVKVKIKLPINYRLE